MEKLSKSKVTCGSEPRDIFGKKVKWTDQYENHYSIFCSFNITYNQFYLSYYGRTKSAAHTSKYSSNVCQNIFFIERMNIFYLKNK